MVPNSERLAKKSACSIYFQNKKKPIHEEDGISLILILFISCLYIYDWNDWGCDEVAFFWNCPWNFCIRIKKKKKKEEGSGKQIAFQEPSFRLTFFFVSFFLVESKWRTKVVTKRGKKKLRRKLKKNLYSLYAVYITRLY